MEQMAKTIFGLVVEKFEGRTDKAGAPYIHHLLHVANAAYSRYNGDIRLLRVGLLHDIMEDTDLSLSELMETQGVTIEIAQAVMAMTHLKNETYSEYIERVAQNSLARRVKICDLEHNMNLSRLPEITAKDVERYCKYLKALEYLKEVEENGAGL